MKKWEDEAVESGLGTKGNRELRSSQISTGQIFRLEVDLDQEDTSSKSLPHQ